MKVPYLNAARRRLALRRMRALAVATARVAHLVDRVDRAIAAQDRVVELEARWNAAQDDAAMHAEQARKLDVKLDRAVVVLHNTIAGVVKAFEADDPEVAMALRLLDALFPAGVAPIVNVPYVEEHALVHDMLVRLRGELAELVDVLDLERYVARVETLNEAYGAVLTQPERLTGKHIKEMDRAGHREVLKLVSMINAEFVDDEDGEGAELHTALLQPIHDQAAELRMLKRRRARGGLVPDEAEVAVDDSADGVSDEADVGEE